MSKKLSLVKANNVEELFPNANRSLSSAMQREDLLKHYVQEGVHVLQGLDNLGNFLMGFGVLMLGYLLNAQLKVHFERIFTDGESQFALCSWICLFAWTAAVLLLLSFMYLFIFHLLAGRTVHMAQGGKETIGQRIKIKHMSYREFEAQAPDFETFLTNNYLTEDQSNATQLWYATFRYTRYMAFCKLMVMNKMRNMLAWAIFCGIVFKGAEIWLKAWS